MITDMRMVLVENNVPRFLTKLQRQQIPFATALAITNSLKKAQVGVKRQAKKDLDRPTPFTLRGFAVDRADKRTLRGRIFVKPIQARYLGLQIFGGTRTPRQTAFALPPAKQMSGDVRRNRFGNVPRSQQARAQLGKGAFSGTVRGIPGVWKPPVKTKTGKIRKNSRMKLLLAYEKTATYRPRFRFHHRARRTVEAVYRREFNHAFRRALRTAR